MKLSICMMVKNEEKYLDKCLKSLQPLRDAVSSELIIVDTGSTDNTIEIAKRYTDKVYFHPWNNNFSEMRNITINYAKGQWIFIIDGDEILYDSKYIIDFLSNKEEKKYNSAIINVKNITDEEKISDCSEMSSLRLFRRDKEFRYEGVVHNTPVFKYPISELKSYLLHYGYLATDKELMKRKFKRTANLLKQELEKDPVNIYYWYQLSVSYAMHDEYDKAIEPIEKAYELLNKDKESLQGYMYVYTQLALVYLMNKQYVKCEKICKEAIKIKDGYIDIYYCLSNSQGILGKFDKAIENYKKYLLILEEYNKNLIEDKTVINYTLGKKEEIYKNLMVVHSKSQEYDKALEYAKKIQSENMINLAIPDIIYVFLKKEDYYGLKKYFENTLIHSKELKTRFYIVLEELTKNLKEEEKIDLFKEFSDETAYGILSKVRIEILNNNFNPLMGLMQDIRYLNFADLSSFYGDIVYYFLKSKADVSKVIKLRDNQFIRFVEYIIEKYKDINEIMHIYLNCHDSSDLNSIRINKIFERTLLILDKLEEEQYKEVFYRFIKDGVNYIESIYSSEVLENEMVYDLKSDEEVFLLYIYKAGRVKDADTTLYIKYLKQALEAYPYMRKGIKILKEDLEKELSSVNNEFEQYKLQVKSTIRDLISNEKLEDAKAIICEYEKVVQDDVEIILFKSEIQLKKIQKTNTRKYEM